MQGAERALRCLLPFVPKIDTRPSVYRPRAYHALLGNCGIRLPRVKCRHLGSLKVHREFLP